MKIQAGGKDMENEEKWNTFTRTGRIQDYLAYAGVQEESSEGASNVVKEEKESDCITFGTQY